VEVGLDNLRQFCYSISYPILFQALVCKWQNIVLYRHIHNRWTQPSLRRGRTHTVNETTQVFAGADDSGQESSNSLSVIVAIANVCIVIRQNRNTVPQAAFFFAQEQSLF
jgi:hypothetical protein